MIDEAFDPEFLVILKRQEERGFDFSASFVNHMQDSAVSARQYLHRAKTQLSKKIKDRKKIYLDTKYWIGLRDCALGRPQHDMYKEIFDLIHCLVQQGRIVVPVSTSMFLELQLQRDPITRNMMADLMDSLSDGVCIDFELDRISSEIVYLLTKYSNTHLHTDRDNFCWTHSGRLFGQVFVRAKELGGAEEKALEKTMIDMLSYIRVRDFLDIAGNNFDDDYRETNERLAAQLNVKDYLRRSSRDFEQVFLDEIGGLVSLCGPQIEEALNYIHESLYGVEAEPDPGFDWQRPKNVFYNLFKLGKITDELPSFRILAGLNANVRCGLTRVRLEANDFEDFRHAASGLPYFDFFFTENSLAHMVTHKPTDYASLYGTIVRSKPPDVLKALKSI